MLNYIHTVPLSNKHILLKIAHQKILRYWYAINFIENLFHNLLPFLYFTIIKETVFYPHIFF